MHFVLHALKVQIRCSSITFFSKVLTEDSIRCHDIASSVLSFLRFTLETDVNLMKALQVSARDWLFTTCCLCLAGLMIDLTELFSFWDFFWGLGLLKAFKLSHVWGHQFGNSLWSLIPTLVSDANAGL